jgi:hypothetical protein
VADARPKELPGGELLSPEEWEMIDHLSAFARLYFRDRQTHGGGTEVINADSAEVCAQVHILQTRVLARAAARAYPDRIRIL